MSFDFSQLQKKFISNPSKAIEESQRIICMVSNFKSYKDFYSYHLKNSHLSTCQSEWSTQKVCIYCRECAISDESCICLKCFLNGNHEGHNILVQKTTGNCDCGDPVYWKKSGFCAKHQGLSTDEDHPEDYLDEKLRILLTDVIFKACFSSLKHFSVENQEKASYILDFVSSFLKFGDGFRRLITISLTERIDFKDLIENIPSYGSEFNDSLQQFCGSFINDKLFLRNFSKITFDIILNKLLKDMPTIMTGNENAVTYEAWNSFWFYCFSEKCFRYNIEKCGLDWSKFGLKAVESWMKSFDYVGSIHYKCIPNLLTSIVESFMNATAVQPNEQTQFFFDNLVGECLSKKNFNIFTTFSDSLAEYHFCVVYHFFFFFFDLFDSFKNKPNLKYEKLFDELEKVDVSPIFNFDKNSIDNDQLISRFYIEKVDSQNLKNSKYASLHNGASVIVSCPLFSSLLALFRLDFMSRIKIARLLSNEKFQSLRVKLGKIALNKILSYICQRLYIVPLNNKGLVAYHDYFRKPKDQSKYFSKFIPLFQLIIGLQGENKTVNDEFCLKEYFAFELAREIGIFDDYSSIEYKDENISEKQKQMIFGFLYVSLLVVVERSLFNYNERDFIQEQIVFALKRGVHSIKELSDLYDLDVVNSWSTMFTFNEILMKVAVTTKKDESSSKQQQQYKQETLFYLKDEIEWKSISAINALNQQMIEMNNEISKDPNKLLKIPSFESEKTFFFNKTESNNNSNDNSDTDGLNVRLKQFLMTPTVLAVVYHTLRMNSNDSGLIKSDLNEHLAMNILILISKFIKEDEDENENDSTTFSFDDSIVIEYESLPDLIMKMKTILFNYRVDNSKNAFIEQTLNSKNFISFIKIKFSSNKEKKQPKCFIDLLLQRGKLGHSVLNEISQCFNIDLLEKDGNQQSNEQDIKERNHQKAKKLKENIMSHYKDIISSYSSSNYLQPKETNSIDDGDLFNSNKEEVCSICSSAKKNDILSFPLYIYRTKFPFVIDKPPLISKSSPGISILDNIHDFDKTENEIQQKEEEESNKNNSEEEEEEEFDDDNAINEVNVDPQEIVSSILNQFPELGQFDGLTDEQIEERRGTFNMLYEQLSQRILVERQSKKNYFEERLKFQRKERKEFEIEKKKDKFKRCTIGANFVLQFSICQHLVHHGCVHEIPFVCPVDRSVKNSLLPSLYLIPKTDILTNLNAIEMINAFIEEFASFFNCIQIESIEIFIELVKSISALISTYEIRLRSLPGCLDSEKTVLLSRNLFLTVWNGYRIRNKPPITVDSESKLTHFQLFVKKLIELDEIDEIDFKKFVSSFIQNQKIEKDDELFVFLRRCCLSEHFLLDRNVCDDDLIDWDEILSIPFLSNRYGLVFSKSENIELKPFTFMNFPREFLRFSESPFNFPVENVEKWYFFNISDYNYLIDHYGETVNIENEKKKNKKNLSLCDESSVIEFIKQFYGSRHSPSLVIAIASCASQLFLVDGNYISFLDTFYLDQYGCADIGYLRSQMLYFNDERYERVVDLVLSGDFAYSLKNLH